MSDVFITHVEEDADLALEIAHALGQSGYTTWCYELDSVPGPSYLVQTGQAIHQTQAVILVISQHSLGSRQVTRELVRALEAGKDCIPVLRGITHVEFQNRQPEWREALGAAASIRVPPEGVSRVLPRIVDGLRALGISPGAPAPTERLIAIRAFLESIRSGGALPRPDAHEGVQLEAGAGGSLSVRPEEPAVSPRSERLVLPTYKVPPARESGAAERGRAARPAWLRASLLAIIPAALVSGVLLQLKREPPPARGKGPSMVTAEGPLVIGVMEIRARGPVPEWMRDFTRDGLNTVLSKVNGLQVYSKQKIDFLREKRRLSEIEAAERLGISRMISGTIAVMDGSVTLEVQVVDIGSGLLLDTERVEGSQEQLVELQNHAAVNMVRALNVVLSTAEAKKILAKRTNETLDAYKLLTETLEGFTVEEERPGGRKPAARGTTSGFLPWPAAAYAQQDGAEETAVRRILESYRAALETKNLDQLAAIQVAMSDSQRDALRRYFENADSLKVQFTNVDILFEGNEALATFTRNDVFKDARSGREMHLEVRMSSVLAKEGSGWKIRGLRKPS